MEILGIADENPRNGQVHRVKRDEKQRGEMAELAFMYKAATLGFAVAKPWGESDRYDAVLRAGREFWRVQVKSAWASDPSRSKYFIRTERRAGVPYTADEIDFLVAYIFAVDAWYIFPVLFIENRRLLTLRPGSTRSRFERYREGWELMRPGCIDINASQDLHPEDWVGETQGPHSTPSLRSVAQGRISAWLRMTEAGVRRRNTRSLDFARDDRVGVGDFDWDDRAGWERAVLGRV